MRRAPRRARRRARGRWRSGHSRRRRRTAGPPRRPAAARRDAGPGRRWLSVASLDGCDAHRVERRGPAVGRPGELADPLVVPARHDRLAGRVLGGRVVKAPLGAALGVAAVQGRGVDGEDQRPVGRTVRDEQVAEPLLVDPAPRERLVEAAVGAAELRLEAERGTDATGPAAQHGIGTARRAHRPTGQRQRCSDERKSRELGDGLIGGSHADSM